MPTIDGVKQLEQITQQALAAPVNNLVAVVALAAIFLVVFFLFIGYKGLPIVTRLFTSLTDSYKAMQINIEKLTTLEAQTATTFNTIIDEMRKQTIAIETSSGDTIDTLTENTKAIQSLVQGFTELRGRVDEVLSGITAKADREELDRKMNELQANIVKAFTEHSKRKTNGDSEPLKPVITSELKAKPIADAEDKVA